MIASQDWLREGMLAAGLVGLLLGSMFLATGSFPPMVVVESGSMMHDLDDGAVGSIDPGDLILVMNPDRVEIITYVEAKQVGGRCDYLSKEWGQRYPNHSQGSAQSGC